MMPNYYQLLAVTPNTTEAEINRKFRELARIYHPDRNLGLSESEKRGRESYFKLLNAAHEVLSDEFLRSEYDKELNVKSVSEEISKPDSRHETAEAQQMRKFYENPEKYFTQSNKKDKKISLDYREKYAYKSLRLYVKVKKGLPNISKATTASFLKPRVREFDLEGKIRPFNRLRKYCLAIAKPYKSYETNLREFAIDLIQPLRGLG